jgi:hypothetical protein
MGTQIKAAKHALFDEGGLDVGNIKLFPGSNRDVTPEDMAKEINKVIDQMLVGDFEDGELVFAD